MVWHGKRRRKKSSVAFPITLQVMGQITRLMASSVVSGKRIFLFLIFNVSPFGNGPSHQDSLSLFCWVYQFQEFFSTKRKIQRECKSLMDNKGFYLLRDSILVARNLKNINSKVIMDIFSIKAITISNQSLVGNWIILFYMLPFLNNAHRKIIVTVSMKFLGVLTLEELYFIPKKFDPACIMVN